MFAQVSLIILLVFGVLSNKLLYIVHKMLHSLRLSSLHQALHKLSTHVGIKLVAAQIFLSPSDSFNLVIYGRSLLLFPQSFSFILNFFFLACYR